MSNTRRWYVVTTAAGMENKVATNLRQTISNDPSHQLQTKIFQIIVVEQDEPVWDKKTGLQKLDKENKPMFKKVNLYPGFIFVEMIMDDDSWYIVRNTQGVSGIAGSSGGGQKPLPISDEEMEPVLKRVGKIEQAMYSRYSVGDVVEIINGPLTGNTGVVESIDEATGVCRIKIVFFGRENISEINFTDIKKK